ncbi:MAG: hypothetical protein ACRD7E_10890 [Bryobacteraceae bacterium]
MGHGPLPAGFSKNASTFFEGSSGCGIVSVSARALRWEHASRFNATAISAQAARRGIKGKKNSADLAAPRESVVREFLKTIVIALRH